MEDAAPLFHHGLPHCLSFISRFYGSWKAAISKLRQWSRICAGRRIVFGDGQGFGLVPKITQYGDVILILHGSKVLIVLRKLGGCYHVIGQCYWHGWMYGKKVDWLEEDGDLYTLV